MQARTKSGHARLEAAGIHPEKERRGEPGSPLSKLSPQMIAVESSAGAGTMFASRRTAGLPHSSDSLLLRIPDQPSGEVTGGRYGRTVVIEAWVEGARTGARYRRHMPPADRLAAGGGSASLVMPCLHTGSPLRLASMRPNRPCVSSSGPAGDGRAVRRPELRGNAKGACWPSPSPTSPALRSRPRDRIPRRWAPHEGGIRSAGAG